jgi:uncharacterized protein YukE
MDSKINNTLNRLIGEIKTSNNVDDAFFTATTKLLKAFEGKANDKFKAMFRQTNQGAGGQQEAIAKAKWDTDPKIRAEFGEYETFLAYTLDDPGFKVKVLEGQAVKENIER